MNKIINGGLGWLIFALLQSCSFQMEQTSALTNPRLISKEINGNLKAYKVNKINLDYIGHCKVRIKSNTENQSGSCHVIVSRFGAIKISLFSPIGGTVFVFYLDDKKIQALDQTEKIFYQLRNTPKNRQKVLAAMNFNITEFQAIIWGRETDGVRNRLKYTYDQGKPISVRSIGKNRALVVSYKKWLAYEKAWFPKLFLIEDTIKQVSIKMVITEFRPGYTTDLKIKKIPSGYEVQSDI